MLDIEDRADGSAGIVGSRLHIDVAKIGPFKDHAVGDTIQGDAAGEAELFESGLTLHEIEDGEVILFEDCLHGCGNVTVPLPQLISWSASRPERREHAR
jgi:hypothetical protein